MKPLASTRLRQEIAALLLGAGAATPRPRGEVRRAQVTLLATLLFGAVGGPLALRAWLSGAGAVAAAVLGLMALGVVNLLTLRRARHVRLVAHTAVSLLVSLLVVAGLCSGGFYDPAFSWLFVAPLLAFLLTDLHGGWAWTGVASVITIAFWLCDAAGFSLGTLTPPGGRAVQGLADRLSNLTGLAAVATAFLFAAKREAQDLLAANERLAGELARRRQTEEDAIAAAIAKTSFLAHMSHEIRTPMVGILGACDLLLQTALTRRQQGLAATIDTSTRSLLSMLNNVLDLSKIDAGQLAVAVEPVDAHAVCEDVVELLAAPAASRGVDLVVHWPADVPRTTVADPLRLRQVLVNLIGNAVKFTEQGHVVVRAGIEPAAGAPVRLRIAVEDTGIGIDPAKLATLFAPFVQADVETTRRYGGTGLGLAITKQLVELMDGALGADSEAGWGSTFWFSLPLAVVPERERVDPPALPGMHVLVVSDRPHTREALLATLQRWQVTADAAATVAEACGPQSRPPYVLLVDVRVADAASLWLDGALRPELPRRTVLLVAPQADALRLCGDVEATISLPVRERQLLEVLADHLVGVAEPEPASAAITAHVLVADDVEINREVACEQLRQLGCTVDLAASGAEAVARCGEQAYDVVFMDCHMPELDGFAATAAIRNAEGPNRTTPIVALTASAFADERERCAQAGMTEYLAKPLGREELRACLLRHVRLAGTAAPHTPPGAAPADEQAVFDLERTLDRIGGNTQLLHRLLGIFRRQTPALVHQLEEAVARGDAEALRDAAHKLNGSLRSVGGRAAQPIAAALEGAAASGGLAAAPALVRSLAGELARLDDVLGEYLAEETGDRGDH